MTADDVATCCTSGRDDACETGGLMRTEQIEMTRTNFDHLVQPIGGLISRVNRLPNHPGEPRFPVMVASLGDITPLSEQWIDSGHARPRAGSIDGAGSGLEEEEARIRA